MQKNVLSGKSLESLFSPENGTHENLKLAVVLFPFGFENEDKNSVSILLQLKSFSKTKTIIQYKFSILNRKNKKTFMQDKLNIFNIEENSVTFGFKKFVSVGRLFKERKELFPNNKFTLYLEGEVIMEDDISEANLNNYNQIFIHSKTPVIDCIVTDKNTRIFDDVEISKRKKLQWSKTLFEIENLDQDLLHNYRENSKIFGSHTYINVSNCILNNSVFNINSKVNAEEINCVNITKEPKYKDDENNDKFKIILQNRIK